MEKRKPLRIIAGILIVLFAASDLFGYVTSVISIPKTIGTVHPILLLNLVYYILPLAVGIMILLRKFTVAGILYAAYTVIDLINSGALLFGGMTALPARTVLFILTELILSAAIAVALLLHDRRSQPLLIAAAGCIAALKTVRIMSGIMERVNNALPYASADIGSIATLYILDIVTLIATAVAWILLGVYFGAQARKREDA